MFDYKVSEAVSFSRDYEYLADRLGSELCKPLAESFFKNMRRVKSLGMFSMEMNYWSSVLAGGIVHALNVLNKPKTAVDFDQETMDLANKFLRQHNEARSRLSPQELEIHTIAMSANNVSGMIAGDTSGEFAAGYEAVLSSMIVEAWSAFEALSIDLWVCLLNNFPSPLAANFCRKSEAKSITLDQLAKFNFEIQGKMGDIVRSFSKTNFSDLKGIMDTYQKTFGSEFDDVLPNNKYLFVAERTRHLIAHRSGIVDEKYSRECCDIEPFCHFKLNERIPLDGAIVAKLVDACVQGGLKLLTWADEWSVVHG